MRPDDAPQPVRPQPTGAEPTPPARDDGTAPFRPLAAVTDPGPGWEPRGDEPATAFPVPWRWWDAILLFILSFALTVVMVAAYLQATGRASTTDLPAIVSQAAPNLLTVALIPVWVALRHRGAGRVLRLFGPARPHLADIGVGVLAGVAGFVVLNLGLSAALQALADLVDGTLPPVQQSVQADLRDPEQMGWTLLTVLLLAPIGEELLYRGVLFQGLRRMVPRWPAIGLSGLAFGLVHIEPVPVVSTFALGMAFAWLFHWRGTLWVTIVAHVVFNGITAAAIVLLPAAEPTAALLWWPT